MSARAHRLLMISALFCTLQATGVLQAQDTWYSYYETALERISEGNWEESVVNLRKALELKSDPELNARTYGVWRRDYLPFFYMGLAYYNLGDEDRALEYFERSERAGVVTQTPGLMSQLQSYREAIEKARAARGDPDELEARIARELERAIELERRDSLPQALVRLESVLTLLDPGNPDAARYMAEIQREIDRREAEARRAAKIDSLLQSARESFRQRRYDESLVILEELLESSPEEGRALALRDSVRLSMEEAAENERQRQARIDRLMEEADRLVRTGHLEEAVDNYIAILELDPGNSRARRERQRIERRIKVELQDAYLTEAGRLIENDSLISARDLILAAQQLELGPNPLTDSLFSIIENSLKEGEDYRRLRDMPRVVVNLPEDSILTARTARLTLSGTASDEDGLSRITLSVNGREHDIFLADEASGTPGTLSFEEELELTPGLNRISLVVYDNARRLTPVSRQVYYSKPFWQRGVNISLFALVVVILAGGYIYTKRTTLHMLFNRFRRRPFELIVPNPFIAGNPIRSREMFFGREDDFRYVKNKVDNEKYGSLIVLFGERRAGKTSVLYQILGGRLGPDYLPVFIDMQAMAVNDDHELLGRVAEIAAATVGPDEVDFDLSAFENRSRNPYTLFDKFIERLLEVTGEARLLMMVDEYELIEEKVAEGKISKDIFHFLSGLVEHKAGLFLIFAGTHRLQERRTSYWEPLFQRCDYRNISFLTANDTRRLIQEPVRGKVFYLGSSIRAIMRLTAGQPFYTQLVCRNIVEMLNGEKRNYFYDEDIPAVVRDITENPPPQMIYFWAALEDNAKLVLAAFAELLRAPSHFTTLEDLYQLLEKFGLNIDRTQLKKAAEMLCRREILEQNQEGSFRFRIDLFRLWIREEHNLYKVSREVEDQVTA